MEKGEGLTSRNEEYVFLMRLDGYLALSYNNIKRVLWKTESTTRLAERLVMESSGNLVLYDGEDKPVWQTYTTGAGDYVILEDNANLVVYDSDGLEVWSTGTATSKIS